MILILSVSCSTYPVTNNAEHQIKTQRSQVNDVKFWRPERGNRRSNRLFSFYLQCIIKTVEGKQANKSADFDKKTAVKKDCRIVLGL